MSSILSLLTSPEGLALLTAAAGALGIKHKLGRAKDVLTGVVDDAEAALGIVERNVQAAKAIAADPDRMLELAISKAADVAGVKVDAKALRQAIGMLVMRRELQSRRAELAAIIANQERLGRILSGEVQPLVKP